MILYSLFYQAWIITILSGVISFFCSEAGYTVLCPIGWEFNRQGCLEHYSSISVHVNVLRAQETMTCSLNKSTKASKSH